MARYTVEHRGKQVEVELGDDQVKLAEAGFLLIRVGRRTLRTTLVPLEIPEDPIEIDLALDEEGVDAVHPDADWFRPV